MTAMYLRSHSTRLTHTCAQGRRQQQHWLYRPASPSTRAVASSSVETASAMDQAPANRRSWHITQQGDMDSLRLVDEPMPELQPGQVLVEAQAWGLNFADVFCALGLYKAAPQGDFVPGLEFAGIVKQVADDKRVPSPDACHTHHQTHLQQQQQQQSTQQQQQQPWQQQLQQQQQQQQQAWTSFKPGDRVLGVLRFGAFSSHLIIPAAYLRPVPEDWTLEQAASYPVQTLTAAYGLFECGGFKPGQTVLVQSAAGGVGLQALQILSKCNAAVLGLVGSDSKVKRLNNMYNNNSSSSSNSSKRRQPALSESQLEQQQEQEEQEQGQQREQVAEPCMEFAARESSPAAARQQLSEFLRHAGRPGFDIILDSLGPGPYFQASYDALSPCGRHVIFGAGALTPKPGLRVSLNPLNLLTAPRSLWGLVNLGWSWLRRPKLDVLNMPGDNKGVVGFNLIWLYDRLDILSQLYGGIEELQLEAPVVDRVFKFEELPQALKYLQSGVNFGKVVLSVTPPVEPSGKKQQQ